MAMVKGGDRQVIRVQDRMWINPVMEIEYFDTVLSYQRALRKRAAEVSRWIFQNGGKTPKPSDLSPMPWPTPAVARSIADRGKPKTSEQIWLNNHKKKCTEKVERTGVIGVNSRYGLWEATIHVPDGKQEKKLFPTKLDAARWRNERVLELFPERPWMLCDLERVEAESRGEKFEADID